MCRQKRILGAVLTAFGVGLLLSLLIRGAFVTGLLGVIALAVGVWLLLSNN